MSQVFEDLARSALAEIAEDSEVGEFLGIDVLESAHVARFAMAHPGYVGWHWSVAISGEPAGIDELWLEPGEGALVAKPWTPWSERIQPGDLAPGDVFPTPADDSRLIPGFSGSDVAEELDEPLRPLQWELGLGRSRVLSSEGVDEAVYRWREGDNGPRTQHARYAELPCSSCGWLLTIGGRLGQAFGVCANAMSPSDGRIVSMDHGCGAHSEGVVEESVVPVTALVINDIDFVPLDEISDLEPETVEVSEANTLEVSDEMSDSDVELVDPETTDQENPAEHQQ